MARVTLKGVRRVSSDPDLVLRLLQEFRDEMKEFRAEFNEFRDETRENFAEVNEALEGMAVLLLRHEKRLRRLESRPSK